MIAALTLFVLWILFLAVMHVRDARDDGTLARLHWSVKWAAYLVLAIGVVLNFFVRMTITCWLFWDGWTWGEWGVSPQVERLRKEAAELKDDNEPIPLGHIVAIWFGDNYLKPFDKTGGHD